MGKRMNRAGLGHRTAVGLRAALGAVLMGLACGAWAQSAAPTRTPTEVPPAQELAPRITPENRGAPPERAAPPRELGKPEDDLRIDVVRYSVADDAPAELRAALPALTARYAGKQRGFEDLVGAAAEVTRFLQRELGFYLAYAYLPEQDPKGGVIRIAVIEGRLDKVELVWRSNIPVRREIVEAYLARLRPGSALMVRDVERVVFLVNDLRGMTARFELRPGSVPGTSTMVVTAQPENTYQGRIDIDRNGTEALGLVRLGGLVQMNSPFGRGDGITATALSTNTGGLKFALLGYNTPLGSNGLKIGSSLSLVNYQLDKDLFPLDLNGKASTFNLYGLYPLVRSRNLNLFTLASADRKAYSDTVGAGGTTKKKVDAASLGATGDFRDSLLGGGVNTFEALLSRGRVTYDNGRPGGLDDDETYTKFVYGYTRLQDLVTNRALVYFAVRGQATRNNLDTTEQFRLGGPDGVRAFNSGEGTGDLGVVLTGELRLLPPEAWFGRVAREMVFSLFGDAGYVQYRYRPDTTQIAPLRNHGKFAGAGLGLAWVRPGGYSLRLAVAKPVGGRTRQGEKIEDVRAWLQAAMLFN
jgi:hemolysin activation/secretion protein